ncbi:hypothetical protein [Halorarum halobium]|uniref:hypothetical protein n=1 Tax=Halorarum halobium TaxID=3075121 RepID=UPI0028AC2ADE|nr:hypothetical protein [Halobaculum sp. XH14]
MASSERPAPTTRLHGDAQGLRAAAAAAGGTHLALLSSTTIDDWHRSFGATGPSRCHYVSVDDTVRGAAAAAGGRAVGGGVFVSVLERPVSDPTSVVDEAFDEAAGGSVVVDDPTFIVEDAGDPDAALSSLSSVAAEAGADLHVGLPADCEAATVVSRHFTPADETVLQSAARAGLEHLRRTDPTNFGYLRSHWREARTGLDSVEMCYPQAKQVHASLRDPETSPRTLGAALGALVELGALGLWGDTVAANRYDLTAYDPERVAAIGEAVESLED